MILSQSFCSFLIIFLTSENWSAAYSWNFQSSLSTLFPCHFTQSRDLKYIPTTTSKDYQFFSPSYTSALNLTFCYLSAYLTSPFGCLTGFSKPNSWSSPIKPTLPTACPISVNSSSILPVAQVKNIGIISDSLLFQPTFSLSANSFDSAKRMHLELVTSQYLYCFYLVQITIVSYLDYRHSLFPSFYPCSPGS